MDLLLTAGLLGILEGLTEFIPVSSTGHLILAIDLLGFQAPPGKVFEIFIQLGAILAVIWCYRVKCWQVLTGIFTQREAQLFSRNVILAVLPALAIGFAAHDYITQALFNPTVVSIALIVGGVLILLVEKFKPSPRVYATEEFGWKRSLLIGFIQCLAMVPGVSRSGATIMGALLCRVERKAAAEFSFFLAIPTMLAATAYGLYENAHLLTQSDETLLATGFIAAFFTAVIVVKTVVGFVSRHGFVPFAWYRIGLGLVMLALLSQA